MKKLLSASIVMLAVSAMAESATNAPSGALDSIPGLNLLPVKWQPYVLALLALSPFIGRAIHAVLNGGGFKGIASALWLGTNTPKVPKDEAPPVP